MQTILIVITLFSIFRVVSFLTKASEKVYIEEEEEEEAREDYSKFILNVLLVLTETLAYPIDLALLAYLAYKDYDASYLTTITILLLAARITNFFYRNVTKRKILEKKGSDEDPIVTMRKPYGIRWPLNFIQIAFMIYVIIMLW
jgi:uncharacterized membrane protein